MRRLLAGVAISISCGGPPAADVEAAQPTPAQAEVAAAHAAPPAGDDEPALADALTVALQHGVVRSAKGDGTYRIDPFVVAWIVEAIESSGARWLTRAQVQGADGVLVEGWQVRVPEGSPLSSLGIEDGDVIEAVSGIPSTDLQAIRAAIREETPRVTLRIFRGDVSHVQAYRLVPGLAWRRARAASPEPAEPPVVETGGGATGSPLDDVDAPVVARRVPGDVDIDAPDRPTSGGGSGPRPTPGKPTSPGKPSAPGTPTASPVSCSSTGQCSVEADYFESMIASPSKLQSQVTIVPAIRDDVHSGYKLSTVKSGSAVYKLGFRSGDKITHVNGYDLTSDAQVLSLYLGMSSMRSYSIRYVRGGKTLTKKVDVVQSG